MINERKKNHESNESLMRRFSRKVQSSGLLLYKKSIQFHIKEPNRQQLRTSAIERRRRREEREYLIKTGKLVEERPVFSPYKKNIRKKN